jgi:3-hydroxybutyrate dehydrogenase
MSLKGKVALVTGSTSGIGLGIARALAAEGADIMMNGFRDAAQIKALQDEIATQGGVRVRYHGADVGKPADCAAMVAAAHAELGGLDILVNNAGVQFVAEIADFPAEQWDRVIATQVLPNVMSPRAQLMLPRIAREALALLERNEA